MREDLMTNYIIDKELRDILLTILQLLQKHSSRRYWRNSDKYSNELRLEDGNIVPLPFLNEIQSDLEGAEEVISTNEYNSSAEELILIAKEMGLL